VYAQVAELVDLPAGRQARYDVSMYFVYVLSSEGRQYWYVGLTNNLERRIRQHQNGKERTTRSYRPFRLVHSESYITRQAARNREKYLKSGVGREWLKMTCA
jgi:putative endonuclease